MNKRMKKKYAFEIIRKKYINVGRIAQKKAKTYTVNNVKVNCIEYDNVGLEFYGDEFTTFFRDIKGNVDFGKCSFKDYLKAFSVLQGFYGLKKSNK